MFLEFRWVHSFFALSTCSTLDTAMCLAQFVWVNPCFLLKIVYILSEVHGQLLLGVQELNKEVSGSGVVTLKFKLSRELIEDFWVV